MSDLLKSGQVGHRTFKSILELRNEITPKKKALITGITGQDGSYLAELLLEKGYEVHGVIRRSSSFNTGRIDHIFDSIILHYGDVTDAANITNLIAQIKPDEIYNLAAQSHVQVSFEMPYYTAMVDGLGTLTILEAVRVHCPKSKFYQASTSELYGGMSYNMPDTGYVEESPFHPRSPYGVAKIYGFWAVKNYREAYNIFACNGILFNHESPRRGGTFVTKKVINNLVEISLGKRDVLKIGNMDSKRDWGFAKEYVEGMWRMLQNDSPEDFVLATNETHTVRELIELTCQKLNYEIEWSGSGENEKGHDKKTRKLLVEIDQKYFRPSEVELLLGDASKAKLKLGWEPKVKFKELVSIMVESEIEELS
jgi:GDPmannose 4,6-dehydratase